MTAQIRTQFVTHFEREAQLAYQGMSKLKGTGRVRRNIEGNKVTFPWLGTMRMVPRIARAPIAPVNPEWKRPEAEMSDWILPALTDVFEDKKTNVDERRWLAQAMMMAVGRQEDQFYLKALIDADTDPNITVDEVEVGSSANTAFSPTLATIDNTRPSKLLGSVKSALMDKEVGEQEMITVLLPAKWYDEFAADPSLAREDWGPTNVTRSGKLPAKNHGLRIIFMGDRQNTAHDVTSVGAGWSSSGGVGWAWAHSAIGLGYGMDPRLKIDWLPERQCWLVCVGLSAAAVAIDPVGLIKITNGPTS